MKRELNELYYGDNNEDVHGFENNINMVPSVDDDIHQQYQQQPTDFDPMDDTDIWLNGNFSTDFATFQDFQCMSSSSSTSNSLPTESDPSSWTVLKSDAEQDFDTQIDRFGNQECLNVMENLGYNDLIDGDHEFLGPISFFHSENPQENQQQNEEGNEEQVSIFQGDSELAHMFLEWLKQNKDYISAKDMRSIKLKRSTIESASKRLGSTKEGKKQLLRLILDWVEQHRLQKKEMREAEAINKQTIQNSAPNYNFDPNACFYPSQWMPNPAYKFPFPDSTPVMAGPVQGYIGDSYSNGSLFRPPFNQTMSGNASSPATTEYQPMDTSQSWTPSHFTMAAASQYNQFPDNDSTNNVAATDVTDQSQALFSQYPYQLFDGNGERLARLGSSVTKEARKNRMARQRRLPSHHYRHQAQNQRQISTNEQSVLMGGEISCAMSRANNPGNWVYWPSAATVPPMAMVPQAKSPQALPIDRPALQSQNHHKHGSTNKKQACRTEKNLKFLLQKVLKQSDVGNLGRIVLPKQKEAESHLPHLESRDGISVAMEDIGTSRVWNMKYRFWPNNKSRMYLLENTGDFVRANGLQEGDFIVIYADMKCGKYLIRGVKVRQNGPKSEGKKPPKKNLCNLSSPVPQAVGIRA
ncbi:B3 domain-containing transcription factor ABI3-like isoform X3 [Lycium barbarum]|uniref:B3 domain-containing transcription factor ABI3-like isoform X3 n=1 Tax=Lycium barbarum TaxID=112863 RepID=UPI00293F03D4|nr:B3 domain-containing transcription factor ABI3-like isoform X3 [Lycium barbarum]